MDLQLLTNPGPKPPIDIYVDTVNTRVLNAQQFSVSDLQVNTLEAKGNVKVSGEIASANLNSGTLLIAATSTGVSLPAGTGGAFLTYNKSLNKLLISGLAGGASTYATTQNGAIWSALTLPIGDLNVTYSPSLNLYSAQQYGGSAIYTSTTGNAGTWNIQTPASFTFNGGIAAWIPALGKFFTDTTDPVNQIAYSSDGVNWVKVPSNRQTAFGIDYSSSLGVLVVVGDHGPQYSKDGGNTWLNSPQTYDMSSVVWSDFWGMFVGLPRASNLTSVYYSIDGINWTQNSAAFPVGFTTSLRDIVWSDQWMTFMAVGDADTMMLSQDGVSWRQVQVTAIPLSMYGLTYVDQWGEFIAIGNSNNARVTPKLFV